MKFEQMKKAFYLAPICVLLLFVTSCKSKKGIATTADKSMSAKNIIKNHYQSEIDYHTLIGRMKINYFDGESSKGVTVSIRMKKDEAIWISAPLGVVKAYITPNRVSFYNKLQKEYFDGDFTYLSQIVGTTLDFTKLQNLLLGQALFDLREVKYDATAMGSDYILKPKRPEVLFKTMYKIESSGFKMALQQLSQPLKKRVLDITYTEYQEINGKRIPKEIEINAVEANTRNTIELGYKNIEFNRKLNFPYKIPKGYKKIVLETDAL